MNQFERVDASKFGLTRENPVSVWVSQKDASHVGLAYLGLTDDGKVEERILHLSGNERLLDAPINFSNCKKQYLAAHSTLPNNPDEGMSATSFAGYLAEVKTNTVLIKFGVDWIGSKGAFDDQGKYTPPAEGGGLTCATFVSELFAGHGFDLVSAEEWKPDSKSALEWRDALVADFESRTEKLPEEDRPRHLALIKNIKYFERVVRLKPAQIAGAAANSPNTWPMNETDADLLATEIIEQFNAEFTKK